MSRRNTAAATIVARATQPVSDLEYLASLGCLAAMPTPSAPPSTNRAALDELAYLASLGCASAVEPPAVKKARRGKKFATISTITIVSRAHKMREGAVNLRRFEALEDGMSVKKAHELGVDNGYLEYYVRNGLIAIA